jgi:hypothetical protein
MPLQMIIVDVLETIMSHNSKCLCEGVNDVFIFLDCEGRISSLWSYLRPKFYVIVDAIKLKQLVFSIF